MGLKDRPPVNSGAVDLLNEVHLVKDKRVINAVEFTSRGIQMKGVRGAVIYTRMVGAAGVMDVDALLFDADGVGSWVEILAAVDVADGVVETTVFDHAVPSLRIRMTATTTPAQLDVHIFGYPNARA